MFSTSLKVAFGYLILIGLLFGAGEYIYRQMTLLTSPTGLEESVAQRRQTTHKIISQLYEAEIIGQTLRVGKLKEYHTYKKAMKEVAVSVDSLQQLLTDTLQQARLDTVRSLLRRKEQNMLLVLETMRRTPADELYRQQIDSLIMQQDSILSSTHVRRKVVTRHNSYTIHHKPKKFFKRLADVFSPGKTDSTQVSNVIQEEFVDTIDEAFNPIDTIANMLTGIQDKVFQTRQEQHRMLDNRIALLRVAGGELSQRVNQLLESIETDEQKAMEEKLLHEQGIREQAARTMAVMAAAAILLAIIFFTVILRDITRSTHYRRELEKAKLYAENLLVAREKLMLTITHDIKAPAGSIIGYIDLLIRLVQDKRQLFYLSNMKSSAQHLLALVTSLLDYHRLEAKKMDLHPVAFSPCQLFDTIYTSFLPLAGKKNLQLVFQDCLPHALTLEGDPFRIRQIVENLLSNALKFTPEGSITLHVEYQGNQLIFSITDTGCGISQEEKSRIFQAFTRLRSAQGQEGFGLGLSITQKLIELLNGKIDIESEPGQGSTFRVSMPLPSVAHPQKPEHPDKTSGNKAANILLIDDDRIQLNLTEAMLHDLLDKGHADNPPQICCCEQPDDLFRLIQSQPFDLLFTDIQMPAMNGFELLKEVRSLESEQAKTLPVIAITARSDMDESDFRQQGFSGCLYKPFSLSDLLQVLQTHLPGNWEQDAPKEHPSRQLPPPGNKYDFSPLTAFSADDAEGAREIVRTFIQETLKNRNELQKALATENMEQLGALAHRMLPTFTMIGAQEAVPALQWLESRRESPALTAEARKHAATVLRSTAEIIAEARSFHERL